MAQKTLNVELVDIDKIRPSPFQPRESFPKEEIRELAETIKKVGLLQPISVRKKGNTYQIIAGERRWRASQFARLERIPAIVKDATDEEMMLESLIENVQRKDLEPIEKGRGLAEVYRLVGFEPTTVGMKLHVIDNKIRGFASYKAGSPLTQDEKKLKDTADMVGLSYDYQYRLLSQLNLSPQEQRRVTELNLGYEKIHSISTIEKPETRRKVIEAAPELKIQEVKKISAVMRKAPESSPVVKAVLRQKSRVTGEVAEKLLELPTNKQETAIKQIEQLRLDEGEALQHVESMKIQVPLPPKEEIEAVRERYKTLQDEIRTKLATPEARLKGALFKNWTSHIAMVGALDSLSCPICNSKQLGWLCHDLRVQSALKQTEEKYKSSIKPIKRQAS